MPLPYYRHLSARDKKIYDQSAKISRVGVPEPRKLWPAVNGVQEGLEADARHLVTRALNALASRLCKQLGVDPVKVKVLATRPSSARSELHGLYTRDTKGNAEIKVWMRTAARSEVVKFRTFLRTFLHEVCHHLDYVHFRLADSLHTEGFFKRESSLMRQLAPKRSGAAKKRPPVSSRKPPVQKEEPPMDLGPNPVETILRQLQSKSSQPETAPSPVAEEPSDPDPASFSGLDAWGGEEDEPTALTDGQERVRETEEPDWNEPVDFDALPEGPEAPMRVYDPGFDEEIIVPRAPAPKERVHVERPVMTPGEDPRQTKFSF